MIYYYRFWILIFFLSLSVFKIMFHRKNSKSLNINVLPMLFLYIIFLHVSIYPEWQCCQITNSHINMDLWHTQKWHPRDCSQHCGGETQKCTAGSSEGWHYWYGYAVSQTPWWQLQGLSHPSGLQHAAENAHLILWDSCYLKKTPVIRTCWTTQEISSQWEDWSICKG